MTETRLLIQVFSLAERRAVLPDGWPAGELPAAAAEEAVELLEWWRETYLSGSKRLMTRRLGALGLDRRTVLPLLAAVCARIEQPASPRPRWQRVLEEVLTL